MIVFFDIMLVVSTLIVILSLVMLFRNKKVYNYRIALLDRISQQAKSDISNNLPWEWRYDVLRSVEYDEMAYKFWRSLDSFYPDKSFLEEQHA